MYSHYRNKLHITLRNNGSPFIIALFVGSTYQPTAGKNCGASGCHSAEPLGEFSAVIKV